MKDLDEQWICEIYDRLKYDNKLSLENLEQDWQRFQQFIFTNFPELDIDFVDGEFQDYWEDNSGSVIRLQIAPIILYFDLPESEKIMRLLQHAAKNNPRMYQIRIRDMGFQFEFKEMTFLTGRYQIYKDFVVKTLIKIKENL